MRDLAPEKRLIHPGKSVRRTSDHKVPRRVLKYARQIWSRRKPTIPCELPIRRANHMISLTSSLIQLKQIYLLMFTPESRNANPTFTKIWDRTVLSRKLFHHVKHIGQAQPADFGCSISFTNKRADPHCILTRC